MKSYLIWICLLLMTWSHAESQTYAGVGGVITDDGQINDFTLDILDLSPDTLDSNFGLVRVCINITHSWVSDLDIRLISPSGVNLMLTAAMGGDGDGYRNTCFIMDATRHILKGAAPFTGSFRPFTKLSEANNSQSGNGTWKLRILDTYAWADGGDLLDWSLTFSGEAIGRDPYEATRLPIIVLETDQVTIPNEPKIPGTIQVIFDEAGEPNAYPGAATFASNMEIEVRGSSSQSFPKKSFGFETQDKEGVDLEIELLGLPKEEDWILYAPYTDKSMLRDNLTYHLGRQMGRYAPRTKACELVINDDYHGIYWVEEKIKRDKNRVDIKKISVTDTIGDALTGGYILKIDRDDGEGTFFTSLHDGTYPDEDIKVVYEDPEGPDLHPKQREYIQQFYHAFESALYGDDFTDPLLGYRRYVDVGSMIDYFIICELGHNVDAYRLSTFFYKDRDSVDSLFHFGPLWDFNLAYGNADYCAGQSVEGWTFEDSGACSNTPLWWKRVQEDPYFRNRLRCRYDSLRQNVLSVSSIFTYLDGQIDTLAASANRNYDRWPILGMYIWPNSFVGSTYDEETNYLKQWLDGRLQWMDENMPGECEVISAVYETDNQLFQLSPNPASSSMVLQASTIEQDPVKLSIHTISGVQCMGIDAVYPGEAINISALPAGVYMVTVTTRDSLIQKLQLVVLQ